MKYRVEREGGLIVEVSPIDTTIAYQNSVLVYNLEIECELFPNELLYATFGEKQEQGGFEIITVPMALTRIESVIEDDKTIWLCRVAIPNAVLAETGTKGVALAIQIPRGTSPETYKQVTSANLEFTVGQSLAGIDYEEIPASNVTAMQAQIDKNTADVIEAKNAAVSAQASAQAAAEDAAEAKAASKTFVRAFAKVDWQKVTVDGASRYRLIIQKSEHQMEKPYVDQMLVEFQTSDGAAVQEVDCDARSLTVTGAVMVYIDVDLEQITEYYGKIILKGV